MTMTSASTNLRSEKNIEQPPAEPPVGSDRAFELTPLPLPSPSPPAAPPPSSPPAADVPRFQAPPPPLQQQETRPPPQRRHRQRAERQRQREEQERQQRQFCRFFVLGGHCRYGDDCAYSHDLPPGGIAEARGLTPCPYHRRGRCRYGDLCQLSHEDPPPTTTGGGGGGDGADPPPSTTNPQRDGGENDAADADVDHPTCGICFDDVAESDKRYGLLSGCSHAFCLDCLKQWRRISTNDSEVRRSCPACRAVSDFVVPSRRYVPDGDGKDRIVEEYKARLAGIPCRNFEAGGRRLGSCPFGGGCFYAHLDGEGRDVKSRDHRRRRRGGRNRGRGGRNGGGIQSDLDMIVTFFNLLDLYGLEFFDESGDDDDDGGHEDDDDDGSRIVDVD